MGILFLLFMIGAKFGSRLLADFFVTTFHDFIFWYFERGFLLHLTGANGPFENGVL